MGTKLLEKRAVLHTKNLTTLMDYALSKKPFGTRKGQIHDPAIFLSEKRNLNKLQAREHPREVKI